MLKFDKEITTAKMLKLPIVHVKFWPQNNTFYILLKIIHWQKYPKHATFDKNGRIARIA